MQDSTTSSPLFGNRKNNGVQTAAAKKRKGGGGAAMAATAVCVGGVGGSYQDRKLGRNLRTNHGRIQAQLKRAEQTHAINIPGGGMLCGCESLWRWLRPAR